MRLLYSLPHPDHRLEGEQAGHMVRARAILDALRQAGVEIVVVEAARGRTAKAAVSTYRDIVRRALPDPVARRLRDRARVRFGRHHSHQLVEAVRRTRPDAILETHVEFSLSGAIASRETGCPLIVDDVTPPLVEEAVYGSVSSGLTHRLFRELAATAQLMVAVNRQLHDALLASGVSASRLVTVENGIDAGLFHTRVDGSTRRRGLAKPGDVVTVFVGSFQPYHRVDLLLEAFSNSSVAGRGRLVLVGEGGGADAARDLARRLGIDERVVFTGRVAYETVPEYVAAGDIAVMPATNEYGNPMKIYEYMAVGTPVVAPDQPTIAELVEANREALLFVPGDPGSLARALDSLATDGSMRAELGRRAAERARSCTWNARAAALLEAIEQRVLTAPPSAAG